jgi:hypothetical protein
MHEDGFAVQHAEQAVVLGDAGLGWMEARFVGFAWHEDVQGVGIGVPDFKGGRARVQAGEWPCAA